jgi:signal peptidase II
MQAARGKALNVQQADSQQPDGPDQPDGTVQPEERPQPLPGAPEQPGGPRRVGLLLAVAAVVYVVDVISKIVVVATLKPDQPVWLISGLLDLNLTRNSGAAFSFGTGQTVVFTVIAIGVIIFILRTSRRLHSRSWAVTLGLLLGGAAGNLTDRLARSPGVFRGEVVDWIQLPHWPVFNVADSCIVCGGVLAVLLAVRGIRLDGTRELPVRKGEGAPPKPSGEPRAGDTQP